MSILNEIFGSGFDLYKFLTQKSKASNISKRLIYRELKNNIQRLEHRNKSGVDRYILIKKLENESIVNAIQEGFDFKKLAPGAIVDKHIIEIFKQSKRYIGWDAEQIVLSIDEKLTSLKDIIEIYSNASNLNLAMRLNNLFYLNIILALLIKKSSRI
jgi:hypothetical protein